MVPFFLTSKNRKAQTGVELTVIWIIWVLVQERQRIQSTKTEISVQWYSLNPWISSCQWNISSKTIHYRNTYKDIYIYIYHILHTHIHGIYIYMYVHYTVCTYAYIHQKMQHRILDTHVFPKCILVYLSYLSKNV